MRRPYSVGMTPEYHGASLQFVAAPISLSNTVVRCGLREPHMVPYVSLLQMPMGLFDLTFTRMVLSVAYAVLT